MMGCVVSGVEMEVITGGESFYGGIDFDAESVREVGILVFSRFVSDGDGDSKDDQC